MNLILMNMKRFFVIVTFLACSAFASFGQRFAYVDTEYIMNKIPAYKTAQQQLDQLSAGWQKEVEAKLAELDKLFKAFQTEKPLLSEDMKAKREAVIVARENEVKELQKKYFGTDGAYAKKQTELVKPIQDRVYQAVKEFADEGGYAIIFDTAGGPNVLYANPRSDRSDDILLKLGYAN